MTKIKEFELKDEYNADGDEYRDAFEALGGGPGKQGCVSKNTLIAIIITEFELTIDMEVRT